MTIYIINFILISIYSWIPIVFGTYPNIKKKLNNIVFFIGSSQLLLILLMRDITVGKDLPGYIYRFHNVFSNYSITDIFKHRFEPLFVLINIITSWFTLNEKTLLIILGIISLLPIFYIIKKYSKNPTLSLLIYMSFNFYSFVFSGLRQSVAIGLVFLSLDFIYRKKPINFILTIVLASLFHKTAVIFFPAYWLATIPLNRYTMLIIISLNTILFSTRNYIFTYVANFSYEGAYEIQKLGFFNWLILSFISVFIPLLFYKRISKIRELNVMLFNFTIVGVSLIFVASVTTQIMRIANYYYIFIIILIPEAIQIIENKYLRAIISMAIGLGLFVVYLWFIRTDTFGIVPYDVRFW